MSRFVLGPNTSKNLETLLKSDNSLSKRLYLAVCDFIAYSPIDFIILENGAFRTAPLQHELFMKGVSKCDGYTHKSEHQKGLAVDLVPWVENKATWKDGQGERKHAFYLAGAFCTFCAIRGLNVTSGADWNRDGNLSDGWDPCHFEIKE